MSQATLHTAYRYRDCDRKSSSRDNIITDNDNDIHKAIIIVQSHTNCIMGTVHTNCIKRLCYKQCSYWYLINWITLFYQLTVLIQECDPNLYIIIFFLKL